MELAVKEEDIARARNPTIIPQLKKQTNKIRKELESYEVSIEEDDPSFDWAVEFAEVFTPTPREQWRIDGLHPLLNDFKRQGTLVEEAKPNIDAGGFDIIVANPPYIQMALFKEAKPTLRRNFPAVHSDRADLYVYFYDRTLQLLKKGGVGTFVSSNKWLRAGYGENLRQHLLDNQAVHLIVDFGDLPVFKASAYPAIFIWQNQPRNGTTTYWAEVTDLDLCYREGVLEHITRISHSIPAAQFGKDKPRLAVSHTANRRSQMDSSGSRLDTYLRERLRDSVRETIGRGIVTGLNEAFIIDQATRENLIRRDAKSAETNHVDLEGG